MDLFVLLHIKASQLKNCSIADDTDYSESEGLSSAQINKVVDLNNIRSPTSVVSETEDESRDG